MIPLNWCKATDSHKVSQWLQLPPGTEYMESHIVARGGRFPATVWFSMQIQVMELLNTKVTHADIDSAIPYWAAHFGTDQIFNEAGFRDIVDRLGGNLPLRIKAVREGSLVPKRNVLMTITNTDPAHAWVVDWVETLLSHQWCGTTVATNSYYCKNMLLEFLEKTGSPENIDFMLHDFGYRGVSCREEAGVAGLAHLTSFKGTDNSEALQYGDYFYNEFMAGFSVPASQHSTVTSWGRVNEVESFRNMIDKFGDMEGIAAYSCVSDSYDIFKACSTLWGEELKADVLAAKNPLVIRPDSGDPVEVVIKCLRILGEAFGTTENRKGYKVLNDRIKILQGDGIDYDMLSDIISAMKSDGWSGDNIIFGSGGGLLRKFDRDTHKFAVKCNAACINGVWRGVYKEPITSSMKASLKGKLSLVRDLGMYNYRTYSDVITLADYEEDVLVTVYDSGKELTYEPPQTFGAIRARLESHREWDRRMS